MRVGRLLLGGVCGNRYAHGIFAHPRPRGVFQAHSKPERLIAYLLPLSVQVMVAVAV